jgi:hypothetical protein
MKRNRPLIIFLTLVLLIVALGGTSFYFYKKSQRDDPSRMNQMEAEALVQEVGKILILPEGEVPTIATVSDPEALKGQVFFVDAKKGYKVLIYANAKKAILYDPKSKRIVNIAPIQLGENTPGTTQ